MLPIVEEVESAALQLPREERARLAERLISSLEEESEVERAWIEEAERRYARYRAGETRVVPAAEVIARMRERVP
ncbi:MAG TPA: addiction module protein [Longimicrobiaceae bacterium]|nr:addiction module protein [Longimicrobiaceae bacterium]